MNYIKRHWRGELTLPTAYWVSGVLFSLPFNIGFLIIGLLATKWSKGDAMEWSKSHMNWAMTMFLLMMFICPVLLVWQSVGIWRTVKQVGTGWGFAAAWILTSTWMVWILYSIAIEMPLFIVLIQATGFMIAIVLALMPQNARFFAFKKRSKF
jgi:hypothetical protein